MAGQDEQMVREGFWPKLTRHAAQLPFADELLAAWYCATDPATPLKVKGTLFGALAYFILPLDAIPDLTPFTGYADDLAALSAALLTVAAYVDDAVKEKARQRMLQWFGAATPRSVEH